MTKPLGNSPIETVETSASVAKAAKPVRLLLAMRDANYRPTIRRLADALNVMDDAKLNPIAPLRGGAITMVYCGKRLGASPWIEGETETERFMIAIPMSEWFSGWDHSDRLRERRITAFDGAAILPDGLLQLKSGLWLNRVEFSLVPLTFELTAVQKQIATLVSAYLNLSGHDLPLDYIDYARLSQLEVEALQPVTDFVRSRWPRGGRAAPSRETIAATLEALFIRDRS